MNESCHLANTSTILLNVCMYAHCMHFQHKIDESHKMLHHYKFISGFVVTTMHSGATHLLSWGHRKNICCKKKIGDSFSFQATEMVLTSKWGRIQQEIQIWPDQVVAASWRLVRSPKHAEKMLIQLIMPTEPSSPTVEWCSYNNIRNVISVCSRIKESGSRPSQLQTTSAAGLVLRNILSLDSLIIKRTAECWQWLKTHLDPVSEVPEPEPEDAAVSVFEALVWRHHSVQEPGGERQRGHGRQQPRVTQLACTGGRHQYTYQHRLQRSYTNFYPSYLSKD